MDPILIAIIFSLITAMQVTKFIYLEEIKEKIISIRIKKEITYFILSITMLIFFTYLAEEGKEIENKNIVFNLSIIFIFIFLIFEEMKTEIKMIQYFKRNSN